MNTELTKAEKISRLPWSVACTATNSVFIHLTVFGPVFILFLNELGLPKTQIGFLLSLFPFGGILALFIAQMVARVGFKRIFIVFYGVRKFAVALLLFTPWVLSQFGLHPTFIFVAVILSIFAICRAISETALFPWFQEVIPDSIRGKFTAINNITASLAGILAIGVASYVTEHFVGLGRFIALIAGGVVFGLVSVYCAFFIPGGASVRNDNTETTHFKQMVKVMQDRNFLFFLGGIGVVVLVLVGLLSFIPLFMKEQVGLSSGNVVLLQIGALLGGLLSSYIWGWAADRCGSKPIMISSLWLALLLPVCWFLIPRHSIWSAPLAMGIAFFTGLATMGWFIGEDRLLNVSINFVVHPVRSLSLYNI